MKTLVLSDKSWHYHFAKWGGFDRYSDLNLCTYSRRFLLGLLVHLLLIFMAIASTHLVVAFLIGICFSIYRMEFFFTDAGAAGFVIVAGAIIAASIINAREIKYFFKKTFSQFENDEEKPNGFIKLAYEGWKNKFCTQIEIERT